MLTERSAMLIIVAIAACRPLEAGETRCATFPIGDTMVTRCKTRPNDPPPAPQQPQGFWCSTRPDGFGFCAPGNQGAGLCESWRARTGDATYTPCYFAAVAICSSAGCYVTPAACAAVERQVGRDGSSCAVYR